MRQRTSGTMRRTDLDQQCHVQGDVVRTMKMIKRDRHDGVEQLRGLGGSWSGIRTDPDIVGPIMVDP